MLPFLMLLGLLAGTWEASAGETVFVETWAAPRAGMMLGTGQVTSGGETRSFEFLRIVEGPDGVVYIAQPRGGAATEFPLVSSDEGVFVFENPQHDHPRRITYRVSAEDLQVTLEGSEPTEVLRFRRVK